MEYLPGESTQTVSDSPNRLVMSHAYDKLPIEALKYTALGLDGGVGYQSQDPSHHPIPLGAPIVSGHLGGFLPARTGPHPRGELLRRRKRFGASSYLGDHLVGRIDSVTRHFGQPLHRIVVGVECRGDTFVQDLHLT